MHSAKKKIDGKDSYCRVLKLTVGKDILYQVSKFDTLQRKNKRKRYSLLDNRQM
jgi:hypothetical protein